VTPRRVELIRPLFKEWVRRGEVNHILHRGAGVVTILQECGASDLLAILEDGEEAEVIDRTHLLIYEIRVVGAGEEKISRSDEREGASVIGKVTGE